MAKPKSEANCQFCSASAAQESPNFGPESCKNCMAAFNNENGDISANTEISSTDFKPLFENKIFS